MNQRRSQSNWQRLIDDQEASGLSQRAFCVQAGVAVAAFQYRKRELRAPIVASDHGWGKETFIPLLSSMTR
ncbi:hypothetical protein MQE22_00525 [Acidithiobacillus sp. YTS05]|nr:hypothetical protein MQE22_00525 [Acidithiobacillus sp. YTS05]